MMDQPLPDSGRTITSAAGAPRGPEMKWSTAMGIGAAMALGGSVLIALLCVAAYFFMKFAMGYGAQFVNQMEMTGIFSVVDDYMTAMYYGDAERAYRAYSEAAQAGISLADLEARLEDDLHGYSQYYDLSQEGFRQLSPTTNPGATSIDEAMEGMRWEVQGALYYLDGDDRSYEAIIIREDGAWKIDSLTIGP